MASTTLYPPIIDAYMPAFLASGYCRLYFSMSEYSSSMENVQSTHLSIVKQSSGQNAVNNQVVHGSGKMEVRSNVPEFNLKPGSIITVEKYNVIYKNP